MRGRVRGGVRGGGQQSWAEAAAPSTAAPAVRRRRRAGTTGTASAPAARISPVGRTRTAPRPLASGGSLRLALASCQNWQHGYFTPYADMAAQDPDVVLFVGDYATARTPAGLRVADGGPGVRTVGG
ncbi:hypothetical protein AQJ58_02345 [Streptomyces sp. DSM 15324]|nr:hypothetical protein AQJ58_02345 [Streptomyces sp. DSM 15324]